MVTTEQEQKQKQKKIYIFRYKNGVAKKSIYEMNRKIWFTVMRAPHCVP